jgi:hypothetical protein
MAKTTEKLVETSVYKVKLVVCGPPAHWFEQVITIPEKDVSSQDMAYDLFEKAKVKWAEQNPKVSYAYIFLAEINKVGDVPVPPGGLV